MSEKYERKSALIKIRADWDFYCRARARGDFEISVFGVTGTGIDIRYRCMNFVTLT